ncbi:hypothetical protein ACLOJK_035959 [Asimina triloba]
MNHLKLLLAALAIPSLLNLPPRFASSNADHGNAPTLRLQSLPSPPSPSIPLPIPKPNSPLFNHSTPPPSPSLHSPPIPTVEAIVPNNLSFPNQPDSPRSYKTQLIAIFASVSLAMLIMFLASSFYLYRRWKKLAARQGNFLESDSQREKLVAVAMDASSSSVNLDAVESRASAASNTFIGYDMNSIHMLESLQPSPELSPMPPLAVHSQCLDPSVSSSDVEMETETSFYSAEDAASQPAPVQSSSSPPHFQGAFMKTQFFDSPASDQEAVTPPSEAEVEHHPPDGQEKDHMPHSPPPESVLAPSVTNPANRAESSDPPPYSPQTMNGESRDPRPPEALVLPARDRRLSRPPSLTVWMETPELVAEDDIDEISEEPLDLADGKEDKKDDLNSSH